MGSGENTLSPAAVEKHGLDPRADEVIE